MVSILLLFSGCTSRSPSQAPRKKTGCATLNPAGFSGRWGFLKRWWFGSFGPFGFGFSFGFPFGWWGSVSVEEELEMLREYKRWLEEELERVEEKIARLEGGRNQS
ncbi:DUF5320 family protein [Ammonifex degensii]|uniref:DUF5320 family protein n=1 Tax=Ammonifex degensii TaxID=42838 RepID=UPI003BF5BBA6